MVFMKRFALGTDLWHILIDPATVTRHASAPSNGAMARPWDTYDGTGVNRSILVRRASGSPMAAIGQLPAVPRTACRPFARVSQSA